MEKKLKPCKCNKSVLLKAYNLASGKFRVFCGHCGEEGPDVMTIPSYLEGKLAKVIWEINCFCLYFPHEDNSYFSECWEYEVIGNIHENPELLEDK